jgi:hypothetical protein
MVAAVGREKAQIKLRLKEPLRAQLADEARRNEVSLNTEIVQRLKASLHLSTPNCWCEPVEVERGVFVHRVTN